MSNKNVSKVVDWAKVKDKFCIAGAMYGKEYEQMCHDMLDAAVFWHIQNPNAEPVIQTSENPTIPTKAINADGKALKEAIMKAVDGNATVPQMRTVLGHYHYIVENGLNAWYEEMNNPDRMKSG